MAFSADELRVLRRALAIALNPTPVAEEDVQDCLRLAESVDEAIREAERLRAFLLADLARYRDALPGAAAGYTELLQDALAAGYEPRTEDLAALRTLRTTATGDALLRRCRALAEQALRARLAGQVVGPRRRPRLLALPGSRKANDPAGPRKPSPGGNPAPPQPAPKPSEVFPPRRKPVPPPERHAVAG
ncbi:hypothetical protein AB0436_26810 [Streptomyces sp. NPDC051322]|uniref:hypothetical protein n=1 Tax=Streptomyces sp. NPDC051322 TaxID=3154645 RepID=UPI00344E3D71